MNPIKLNTGIGVTGIKSQSKSKSGDSTKYEITLSGSQKSHLIPKVILFCEDKFAESMIINALSYKELNHGAFKIIHCGVWHNIIKALAGCLLYEKELIDSGNGKALKVIGIIDGDVSESDISTAIKKTYKGSFLPAEISNIIKIITEHVTSFKITQDGLKLPELSTGLPEFNLKIMLDDITEEMIRNYHKEYILKYEGWLKKTATLEGKVNLTRELEDIKRKIKETLEIIETSKNIKSHELPKNSSNKFDYHYYFETLKERIGNKHFNSYSYSHDTELLVYRIISTYSKSRWEEYITPVTNLLISVKDEQVKRFNHNTFNNDSLD
ncbi:hypothetical protein HV213_23870 [Klebsiella sp. RHBSTW-00484]|uniref:hypothetical protein n=1 Tax=unclassified Klebsiella TaxID=2608929 RepID=UPI0015E577DA|nr:MULTISPECIES: hypothetical protein [unclassified Klebsiella]MBA7843268.1 hypothetical protein [Klebsiella sp. RHBSTW-00465]MBA7844094.1 hypothetical protein [Klebsiella sp. RHBSTW-00465]QLO38638.1 hypothetical protein HV213_23870 [Klebsiella sp. RHBSTW-00484]QLT78158.1 hypothetical protein HV204_23870 [Klebsiella sp. RHBSTW-00464]